ncbi:hypothetical protein [Aestuariivirga sp.]|uniref:hypothetical protein n=1 Tax=Aestuariivirga sp. TaxID=2650926 RepID=UPI0025BF8205|nr:hypothetical protein [Aestuariivirga sp.]MCA3554954.1 hypothetical protein [Aestuariivirga sp.]
MAAEKPSSDAHKQRLAKALKANIARRKAKAQAAAQTVDRPAAEDSPETPPEDGGCRN